MIFLRKVCKQCGNVRMLEGDLCSQCRPVGICAAEVRNALSYVHYWEARERGEQRLSREGAAIVASKQLNEQEKGILYRALNLPVDAP